MQLCVFAISAGVLAAAVEMEVAEGRPKIVLGRRDPDCRKEDGARPELPEVEDSAVVFNAIDSFVLERLKLENRLPSAVAERTALIRRVTFDLTGLPPSVSEIEAFENDNVGNSVIFEQF